MFLFSKKYLILLATGFCLMTASALLAAAAEVPHARETHKAAVYRCPMHPQVVSDKPGECPICHMRLVLDRYATGDDSGVVIIDGRAPVVIQESSRQTLDIQTASVETKALQKTVEAWGRIAHDPELYALEVDFFRAETLNFERERSKTLVSQGRGLTGREKIAIEFLDKGLTKEWIDDLLKRGVPDRKLVYHHEPGGAWAYIDIRESDAPLVKKGDKITIKVPNVSNLQLESKVEYVDGKVDEEKGTVRVRAIITDPSIELKPHRAVSASIRVDLGSALVIPEEALLFTGEKAIVFVDDDGTFKPREVSLGTKVGGYYQVIEGLMEGEKIASSGAFFIDSESRLRSASVSASHGGHAS